MASVQGHHVIHACSSGLAAGIPRYSLLLLPIDDVFQQSSSSKVVHSWSFLVMHQLIGQQVCGDITTTDIDILHRILEDHNQEDLRWLRVNDYCSTLQCSAVATPVP